MFQLKGCRLDACAPSSFLAGSAKSASALKQDATKGVGSRQGISRALSPVFKWIRVRVAPGAVRWGGGNSFARPAGRPGCRCPGLRTALASQAGKAALNNYYPPTCVRPMERLSHACPRHAPACRVLPRAAPRRAAARTPRTGYCGRRRRSDRPFRTGFIRWLEKGCEVFHKPPSFMKSLNPFFKL